MIKVYNMDVMKALKQMPDESVDMQITSPPYWGLRDYGIEGQLGLEPTFDEYINKLCDIFDEVKRVLKKDGTCWVNLGDTYSGNSSYSDKGRAGYEGKDGNRDKWIDPRLPARQRGREMVNTSSIQAKCMCCIPERFCIEMINRGWILRNKIIWHKPNHMPTSVKDRFANSWEYLFLFSKSKKYYFDLDAVREPHTISIIQRLDMRDKNNEQFDPTKHKLDITGKAQFPMQVLTNTTLNPKGKNPDDIIQTKFSEHKNYGGGGSGLFGHKGYLKADGTPIVDFSKGKNPDDVIDYWDITTKGYKEAHFAVFPEKLVERPIKTTKKNAVIMDIFAGSGTTLKVARDLGRDSVGIEIKPDYCKLIHKRLFVGNNTLFKDDFEIIK